MPKIVCIYVILLSVNFILCEVAKGSRNIVNIDSKYDIDEISKLYNLIDDVSPFCRHFMINFKASLISIEQCILKYSNPIHYCQRCIDQFILFNQSYQDVMNKVFYPNNSQTDSSVDDCQVQILQVDRVQPLTRSYYFILDLWNAANCYDCFTFYKDENSGKTFSYSLSNSTYQFYEYYYNFVQCEKNYSNPLNGNKSKSLFTFCNDCADEYIRLNKFYTVKSQGDVNSICVDISDLMNHTYHKWKEYYHCKSIRIFNIPFLTIQLFIIILPIIFYTGAYLHSTKKESIIVKPRRFSDYFQPKPAPSLGSLNISDECLNEPDGKSKAGRIPRPLPHHRHNLINVAQAQNSFSAPSRNNFLSDDDDTFKFKFPKRVMFTDDYNHQQNLLNIEESSQEKEYETEPKQREGGVLFA